MKINNKIFVGVNLYICFFLIGVILLQNFEISFKFYQGIILILFLMILIYGVIKKRIILNLFMVSLFTFQLGRLILLPLLYQEKIYISWFINYIYSEKITLFSYNLIYFNIISIFLGILIFEIIKFNKKDKLKKIVLSEKIEKILYKLLLITFPFFLFVQYEILRLVITNGYTYIYKVGIRNLKNTMPIINLGVFIFSTTLFLLLTFVPNNKKIKKITIFIFTFQGLILSLRGQRSIFIATVFGVIWYISEIYNFKFNVNKIINILILLIVLIFFSENIQKFRGEDIEHKKNIYDKVKFFINDQGGTGVYLGLLKTKEEMLNKQSIPYIFAPIIGVNIQKQDRESYLKIKNSDNVDLKMRLSAELNKKMFISGNGTGGNYLMEMYSCGKILGIIFFSTLLTLFLLYIGENFIYKNILIRGFIILLVTRIFTLPRTNYFIIPYPADMLKIIILSIVYLYLKNKKMIRKQ